MLANALVTFQQQGTGLSVTTPVSIYRASRDARLYPDAAMYQWAVCWDDPVTYPDGSAIVAGDQLVWSVLGTYSTGAPRAAAIGKPRLTVGALARRCAYFNEVNR